MISSIFSVILLYFLLKIIVQKIRNIKTFEKDENYNTFWMFSYDFKEKKKTSIFDRESQEIIDSKNKKNKLIVLLYFTTVMLFIYTNLFIVQILSFILGK